jgi:hypothetical protein
MGISLSRPRNRVGAGRRGRRIHPDMPVEAVSPSHPASAAAVHATTAVIQRTSAVWPTGSFPKHPNLPVRPGLADAKSPDRSSNPCFHMVMTGLALMPLSYQ